MNRYISILAALCTCICAEALPIRYSLSDINAGLGHGLSLSNCPAQLDDLQRWSGSLDEAGFSLGDVNSALAIASALTNDQSALRSLESFVADSIICKSLSGSIDYDHDPAGAKLVDLSSFVGQRRAIVVLRIRHVARSLATYPLAETIKVYPYGQSAPHSGIGTVTFDVPSYTAEESRVAYVISCTDQQGRIEIWNDSADAWAILYVNLIAYLHPRDVDSLILWRMFNGYAVFFDGIGSVNASGAPVDSHSKPSMDTSASWPVMSTTGDWIFSEKYGCPAWFDGVGWLSFFGAPLDGHTRPAANGSYSRPVNPAEGDMELDQALWIPIWYWGGAWINATGAEV